MMWKRKDVCGFLATTDYIVIFLFSEELTGPAMGDWKDVLDRLLKEVQEDEACQKLLKDLPAYALYAVAKNEADIRDTLRNRVKAQVL